MSVTMVSLILITPFSLLYTFHCHFPSNTLFSQLFLLLLFFKHKRTHSWYIYKLFWKVQCWLCCIYCTLWCSTSKRQWSSLVLVWFWLSPLHLHWQWRVTRCRISSTYMVTGGSCSCWSQQDTLGSGFPTPSSLVFNKRRRRWSYPRR